MTETLTGPKDAVLSFLRRRFEDEGVPTRVVPAISNQTREPVEGGFVLEVYQRWCVTGSKPVRTSK